MNRERLGLNKRLADRDALFGNSASSSKSNSRSNSPLPMHYPRNLQQDYAARTAEEIEGQNEGHLEGLRAKVGLLKDITTAIGKEVRDSTKMLNGMNDTFDETGGFLGGTMNKMKKMSRRQGGQWCIWMAFLMICFFVFFWTWVWRR